MMFQKYKVFVFGLVPKYLIHIKYFSNTTIEHDSGEKEHTFPFYTDSQTKKLKYLIIVLLDGNKFHVDSIPWQPM